MRKVLIFLFFVLVTISSIPGISCAYTRSLTINQTLDGQNMIFSFTSLPRANGDVSITVTLYGDYDLPSEYAEVWVDDVKMSNHEGGSGQCTSAGMSKTYQISSAFLTDGALNVRVDLSDAVDAICANITERVVVTLTYNSIDLYFYYHSISPTAVSGAGDSVTVAFRVRNNGADTASSFSVYFYYGDFTSTAGLTYLGSYALSGVAGGAITSTINKTITLPNSCLYGSHYIHYYVDAGNNVTEYDESNNRGYKSITITGQPNLQVSYFSIGQSAQNPGEPINVSLTIRNDGSTRVSGAFYTRLYFSDDETITTSDSFLTSIYINSLDAGESSNYRTKVFIPSSASTGRRYIGAITDYNNRITESNETDNTRSDSLTIYVPEEEKDFPYFLFQHNFRKKQKSDGGD